MAEGTTIGLIVGYWMFCRSTNTTKVPIQQKVLDWWFKKIILKIFQKENVPKNIPYIYTSMP